MSSQILTTVGARESRATSRPAVRAIPAGCAEILCSASGVMRVLRASYPHIPHAYILAAALSNLFNITFSYLSYKRFIFKTRGNYVREWMKCVAVYAVLVFSQ